MGAGGQQEGMSMHASKIRTRSEKHASYLLLAASAACTGAASQLALLHDFHRVLDARRTVDNLAHYSEGAASKFTKRSIILWAAHVLRWRVEAGASQELRLCSNCWWWRHRWQRWRLSKIDEHELVIYCAQYHPLRYAAVCIATAVAVAEQEAAGRTRMEEDDLIHRRNRPIGAAFQTLVVPPRAVGRVVE